MLHAHCNILCNCALDGSQNTTSILLINLCSWFVSHCMKVSQVVHINCLFLCSCIVFVVVVVVVVAVVVLYSHME